MPDCAHVAAYQGESPSTTALGSLQSMSPRGPVETPDDESSDEFVDSEFGEGYDGGESETAQDVELHQEEDEWEASDNESPVAPTTLTGRVTQLFSRGPTASVTTDDMTDEEKAAAIRQVDPLERRIGYGGALLTVLIGLVEFIPYIRDPSKRVADDFARVGKHCPKGWKYSLVNGTHQCVGTTAFTRTHWITELVILLFFGAFLAVATRYGRRSLVAFSMLFAGLAVTSISGSVLGVAYIGAGAWLMVRAYRVQKYGTTKSKEVAAIAAEQRAERKAARGTGGATRPSSRSTSSSSRSSTSSSKSSASTRPSASRSKSKKDPPTQGKPTPQANKRYTPKTPPRKRPVPPS